MKLINILESICDGTLKNQELRKEKENTKKSIVEDPMLRKKTVNIVKIIEKNPW